MGDRRWGGVFKGVEMARINSSFDEKSGYLTSAEWQFFCDMLIPAQNVCKRLAYQHKKRLFKDSRWPATGLISRVGIKNRYIRLTLNHNYLDDKQIFFELRTHDILIFPVIFYKILSNNVLRIFTVKEITNEYLLENSIMSFLKDLDHQTSV